MAVMIAAASGEMACGGCLLRYGGDDGGEEPSQKPVEPRAKMTLVTSTAAMIAV